MVAITITVAKQKLDVDSARNMTYSAEGVYLTQTDDQGHLYIRAKVDRLEQNMQNQTSKLENLNASTYKTVASTPPFSKYAHGYNDNAKVVLSDQVVATKLSDQGKIEFKTDELTTYPDTKLIETSHQVNVDSPQSSFISNGLKANLNTGQYEFLIFEESMRQILNFLLFSFP